MMEIQMCSEMSTGKMSLINVFPSVWTLKKLFMHSYNKYYKQFYKKNPRKQTNSSRLPGLLSY